MAGYSANSINYFLSLPVAYQNYLGSLRHWDNLEIGFEEDRVWIKNLTGAQADSIDVKTIPYKELYYASGTQLFLKGKSLPERTIPALPWTPIEKGLPVQLPSFNHNYFGLHDKVTVHLQPTDVEQEAFALLTDIKELENYITSAPAIRLSELRWVVINKTEAFIFGKPILPVQGKIFWRRDDFLFPAGYTLELPVLLETLPSSMNNKGDQWMVWNEDGTLFHLPKAALKPLSIASFRKTVLL